MEKRVLSHWLIKRDGKYLNARKVFTGHRCYGMQYASGEIARADAATYADAHAVPVFVTVTKKKRAHGWAWACRRMLEGKRVRRAEWTSVGYMCLDGNGCVSDHGKLTGFTREWLEATDWQVHS